MVVVIATVVFACAVIAITVASRSAKKRKERDRQDGPNFLQPQSAANYDGQQREDSSELHGLEPLIASLGVDVPHPASDGGDMLSTGDASLAEPLDTWSASDPIELVIEASADAPLEPLKNHLPTVSQVFDVIARSELPTEAEDRTDPPATLADQLQVPQSAQVSLEAHATETKTAAVIADGESVIVFTTENPRALNCVEVSPSTSAAPLGDPSMSPETDEITGEITCDPKLETQIAVDSGCESAKKTDIDDNSITASVSRYQAPRISDVKHQRTDSRLARTEQPPRLQLTVKARVHKNYWTFVLLAPKPVGAPLELEVRSGTTRVQLIEANDEWYEAPVDSLADWLNGVSFLSLGLHTGTYRWQLTAREIHVLASDNAVSGWASTTRLVLGRRHLVLCSEARKNEVAALVNDAGCVDAAQLGEDSGTPRGWVLFWPVTPSRPVAPIAGEELLNVLRPLPDVQISLDGGLPLQGSTWMVGYPPTIRVTGDLGEGHIFIDEEVAARAADGEVKALGYHIPGEHRISIGGRQSRTYSIVQPELTLDEWIAYDFPMGSICGAVVTPSPAVRFSTKVSASNPLLIGSEPGQVYLCPTQPGAEWTAFPPFEPVWALPAVPLRCRKRTSQITPLHVRPPAVSSSRLGVRHRQLWRWINAIRDARRKGLQLKGQSDDVHKLWVAYAQVARDLWRRMR